MGEGAERAVTAEPVTGLEGPRPGSVAMVTGAGGGIGAACTLALAAHGVRLCLLDLDRDRVEAVADRVRGTGVDALALVGDAADPGFVGGAVERARTELGAVDIAMWTVSHELHGGFLEVDRPGLDRSFDVTVRGCWGFCQRVAESMIDRGRGGRIVVIGSLHAVLPFAGAAAYNVVEAALAHLAATMAHELASDRIAVNVVQPGWVDTPGERVWYTQDQLAGFGRAIPFGRLAAPADIAKAAVFLASPSADYITGATLRVDGGLALSLARLPGSGS